jgi:hypothetical protein
MEQMKQRNMMLGVLTVEDFSFDLHYCDVS